MYKIRQIFTTMKCESLSKSKLSSLYNNKFIFISVQWYPMVERYEKNPPTTTAASTQVLYVQFTHIKLPIWKWEEICLFFFFLFLFVFCTLNLIVLWLWVKVKQLAYNDPLNIFIRVSVYAMRNNIMFNMMISVLFFSFDRRVL